MLYLKNMPIFKKKVRKIYSLKKDIEMEGVKNLTIEASFSKIRITMNSNIENISYSFTGTASVLANMNDDICVCASSEVDSENIKLVVTTESETLPKNRELVLNIELPENKLKSLKVYSATDGVEINRVHHIENLFIETLDDNVVLKSCTEIERIKIETLLEGQISLTDVAAKELFVKGYFLSCQQMIETKSFEVVDIDVKNICELSYFKSNECIIQASNKVTMDNCTFQEEMVYITANELLANHLEFGKSGKMKWTALELKYEDKVFFPKAQINLNNVSQVNISGNVVKKSTVLIDLELEKMQLMNDFLLLVDGSEVEKLQIVTQPAKETLDVLKPR